MVPTQGDAIWAAGDYWMWMQAFEGHRVADLQWGTANAKQIVIRFWMLGGTIDTTYAVAVRNGAVNRCYVAALPYFPISGAGYSSVLTAVIPGDTSGTWAKDNTVGMYVSIVIYAGTTYQTPANVWTAGNKLFPTGVMYAPRGNEGYSCGNIGMYADPNRTGRAPPWERLPDGPAMIESQRYWQKNMGAVGVAIATTGTPVRAAYPNQGQMRVTPTSALVGVGRSWDQATAPNITAIAANYCSLYSNEWSFTSASAQTAGRASVYLDGSPSIYIAQSARM